MNRLLSPLLIGALACASVAAVDGLDLLDRAEQHRGHADKTFDAPMSLFLPDLARPAAPCVDGMADVFPCDGVDLLSFTPASSVEGDTTYEALNTGFSDMWGWVDPQTNDEYVIVGKTHAAGFFRITDARSPEYLGELPGNPGAHLRWYDIKVYDDHAFIVSESNPAQMRVFDLTRLRSVTGEDPQIFTSDADYPLAVAAHNIAINADSGHAYIVGGNAGLAVPDPCRSGLHIVAISEPTQPTFAGCYLADGGPGLVGGLAGDLAGVDASGVTSAYVHDTQCVNYGGPDPDHVGKEICFNSSETFLDIVDVSDKLFPVSIGQVAYEHVGYTHQGWLTDDRGFFLLGDEGDENSGMVDNTRTLIFDVSDLDDPKVHGEHFGTTQAIDHNMYTRGHLLFQSNYEAGLRILDTSELGDDDPQTPHLTELAYFDVYPTSNDAEFNGTWSNYPYFPSGTIAVSSYDGLFLLELSEDVDFELPPLPDADTR